MREAPFVTIKQCENKPDRCTNIRSISLIVYDFYTAEASTDEAKAGFAQCSSLLKKQQLEMNDTMSFLEAMAVELRSFYDCATWVVWGAVTAVLSVGAKAKDEATGWLPRKVAEAMAAAQDRAVAISVALCHADLCGCQWRSVVIEALNSVLDLLRLPPRSHFSGSH